MLQHNHGVVCTALRSLKKQIKELREQVDTGKKNEKKKRSRAPEADALAKQKKRAKTKKGKTEKKNTQKGSKKQKPKKKDNPKQVARDHRQEDHRFVNPAACTGKVGIFVCILRTSHLLASLPECRARSG